MPDVVEAPTAIDLPDDKMDVSGATDAENDNVTTESSSTIVKQHLDATPSSTNNADPLNSAVPAAVASEDPSPQTLASSDSAPNSTTSNAKQNSSTPSAPSQLTSAPTVNPSAVEVPSKSNAVGINGAPDNSHSTIPSRAMPYGAPARQYLNEKVTGVLLEGMKRLAAEQPEMPLQVLGKFLLQKSQELESSARPG